MNDFPKLANPPAVETILDVQIHLPVPPTLEMLEGLHPSFASDFPHKDQLQLAQFGFQQKPGQMPEAVAPVIKSQGCRFISEDKKEIVQCRQDGLTFNRLKPYPGWEIVSAKASSAWDIYQSAFHEMGIVRVGLRYINQVLIPIVNGNVRFKEYFKLEMPGPKVDGFECQTFFNQGGFRDKETGFISIWTLAHQPSPDPTKLCVALDINVQARGAVLQEKPVQKIWEEMRAVKNRLFFGSFEAKGIELFQ
ncbi:MAG: TIGR04255 family protein [Verrucomicrobia bacterium]|nr:TIGR04255 family protein [Verrucomicrobiota bacterium]